MTQFAQSLGFDLADAFAGYIEIPADFFQGVILAVDQTKAQVPSTWRSRSERRRQGTLHLFAQHFAGGGIHGFEGFIIFNEVAQLAAFFITHRAFQ